MKTLTLILAAVALAAAPISAAEKKVDHKETKECKACCGKPSECDACCHDKGKGEECKSCCSKKK